MTVVLPTIADLLAQEFARRRTPQVDSIPLPPPPPPPLPEAPRQEAAPPPPPAAERTVIARPARRAEPALPLPPPDAPPIPPTAEEPARAETAPPPNQNQSLNERLMNFGFAMAASQNPSVFGQIGEGGQAMQRAATEARREDTRTALQTRELNIMQEFRRAQIRVQEAEQAWAQDPTNPRNQALLMQARAQLAAAGNGVQANSQIAQLIPSADGRSYVAITRTGDRRIIELPEGFTADDPRIRQEAVEAGAAAFSRTMAAFAGRPDMDPDRILQLAQQAGDAAMRGVLSRGQRGAATQRPEEPTRPAAVIQAIPR